MEKLTTQHPVIVCILYSLISCTMNSQEFKTKTPSEYFHEADGLRSEILYTIYPEDSTIEISCNLKNISEHSLYFVGYSIEKGNTYNTYKDYFKIECGNITKVQREDWENVKLGFYDDETVYIHLQYINFFFNNHVLSTGWCFRSELQPGKVFGTKATLKVDCKKLKYIDVSIDFVYKSNESQEWITDDDIKSHVYKIPLTQD